MKFDVRDVKRVAIGSSHDARARAKAGGGQSTHYRWEITAGEVKIELDRGDDGPISLAIDGEDYGMINEGDALLIGAQRQVHVNGARRESPGATND